MTELVNVVHDQVIQRISQKFLQCRKAFHSIDMSSSSEHCHEFGNIKLKYACPYVQDFMSRLAVLVNDDAYNYSHKNDPGPNEGFDYYDNEEGTEEDWHNESWLQLHDGEVYSELKENMYVLVEYGAWNLQINSITGLLYNVDDPRVDGELYKHAHFVEWWEKGLDKFLMSYYEKVIDESFNANFQDSGRS